MKKLFLLTMLILPQLSFGATSPQMEQKTPKPYLDKVTFVKANETEVFYKIIGPTLPYCKLTQFKASSKECKDKQNEIYREIRAIVKNETTSFVVGFRGDNCRLNSFDYYDCTIPLERMVESYEICVREKDEEACKTFLISNDDVLPTQLERDLYNLRGFAIFLDFCHNNSEPLCKVLGWALEDNREFLKYVHNKKLLLKKIKMLEKKIKSKN